MRGVGYGPEAEEEKQDGGWDTHGVITGFDPVGCTRAPLLRLILP
jgi:hypothetical protein